ncbi:hypothetical protein CEXT_244211 [Caerostris extrusa]|uniref:Uncharacterized protein n=1 Tax=Caerostris extrusa TaxID=172846 RepID=A0AAV4UV60_CAEEX|nr:hypothetical protein CEXT_244211 [Caerostris extrusa]
MVVPGPNFKTHCSLISASKDASFHIISESIPIMQPKFSAIKDLCVIDKQLKRYFNLRIPEILKWRCLKTGIISEAGPDQMKTMLSKSSSSQPLDI